MKNEIKKFMLVAMAAGSLSLVSCREVKEDEAAPPMQHEMREGERMNEGAEDTEVMEDRVTAQFNDEAVASNYQHYINIKKALVQTDAAMAQDRAKEMVAQLESNDANSNIAGAARDIATTMNVDEQREAFSHLTREMEAQLDGAIASGEIYKQYCPMAFEGKGDSWFSNSQEIRNPYYGDKMLKCGRVEATLN